MTGLGPQSVTVAVTVLALLFSLWPAAPVGVWLGTGVAAGLGLTGAAMTAGRELGPLLSPTPRRVSLGILGGLIMGALTHLVYPLALALIPSIASQADFLYGRLDSPPGRVTAVPIMLAVVTAEELVFRGLLYGQLEKRFPKHIAVVAALLIYAIPQLASGTWLLPALALGCGLIWTLQRAISGNLVVPLLTHIVWDVIVLVVWPMGG